MKRLQAYAQLMRLPNVFTAMADIGMGVLASSALPQMWWQACCLFLASACAYCGGMVWNDIFDVEEDKRDRPFRPLPSGRIPMRAALFLGIGLIFLSFAAIWPIWYFLKPIEQLPSTRAATFQFVPPIKIVFIITLLWEAIFLYDGWLKRNWAGPLGMGICRFLNVLLGWSLVDEPYFPWSVPVHAALVVGLYIVGVTWFARTEAKDSNRFSLLAAAFVMISALGMVCFMPVIAATSHREATTFSETTTSTYSFPLFLFLSLVFVVAFPVIRAIVTPTPAHVQAAVKRSIMGLIVLDAVLATTMVGSIGLILLVLLLPALYVGRWIYST